MKNNKQLSTQDRESLYLIPNITIDRFDWRKLFKKINITDHYLVNTVSYTLIFKWLTINYNIQINFN